MPLERIVSLVPSLTELLFWLGAGQRVVGRTKFCIEPADLVVGIQMVGGTKNPEASRIGALRPNLVLANKEENRREDIEAMQSAGLNVVVTDPNTVGEAVEMIRSIGSMLGAEATAADLGLEIEAAIADVPEGPPVPVYVGVWHNPMMGLGSDSYGHSLIEICGGRNVLGHLPRYPETSMEALASAKPGLILLPDEPFPFDAGHARLYGAIAPARMIDGKLLWWYGPRMPKAIRELSAIFNEGRKQ